MFSIFIDSNVFGTYSSALRMETDKMLVETNTPTYFFVILIRKTHIKYNIIMIVVAWGRTGRRRE